MCEAKEILLEINRSRSDRSLFIHQSKYTKEILERFCMQNARPVSIPLEASSESESELFPGSCETVIGVSYRQATESIMYLMIGTRLDLAFAIQKLSQFLEKPSAATLDRNQTHISLYCWHSKSRHLVSIKQLKF